MDTLDDVMMLDEATRRALAEMQAAFEQQAAADYDAAYGGRSSDTVRDRFINDSIDRQRNMVRSASGLMQSNSFDPALSGGLQSAAPLPAPANPTVEPARLEPLPDTTAATGDDNDAMRALALIAGMAGLGGAAYSVARMGGRSGVSGANTPMAGRAGLPAGSMGALPPGPRVNVVGSPAALNPGPAAGGYRFAGNPSLPAGPSSLYMRFNMPAPSLPAGPSTPYIPRVNMPASSLPGSGATSAFPRLGGLAGNSGGFPSFIRAGGGGRLYGR